MPSTAPRHGRSPSGTATPPLSTCGGPAGPLASCRAVLFAQLVDDPSSWPEGFPTEEDQAQERERLHGIIREMVPWEATSDERVWTRARYEIARSLARGLGVPPPPRNEPDAVLAWLAEHAPPVCDPFCGGGSIPLEAQRLGLRAHGSDLNPVAVLVSKATCEIPPKICRRVTGQPRSRQPWRGERCARFGRGHPLLRREDAGCGRGADRPPLSKVRGDNGDGAETTRPQALCGTRNSPSSPGSGHAPSLRLIPCCVAPTYRWPVRSSYRQRRERRPSSFRTSIRKMVPTASLFRPAASRREQLAKAKSGTKASRGANFTCLISGSPIPGDHIKAEGMAGRMGARLMAVVTEGQRGRVYLEPTEEMEEAARGCRARVATASRAVPINDSLAEHATDYGLTSLGRPIHRPAAGGVGDIFRHGCGSAGSGAGRRSGGRHG